MAQQIRLRLPSTHPNQPVIQRWADDKEKTIDAHERKLAFLEGILKNVLSQNPDLLKNAK